MNIYINSEAVTIEATHEEGHGFTQCYVVDAGYRISRHSIPTAFLNDIKSPACRTNGNLYSHKNSSLMKYSYE